LVSLNFGVAIGSYALCSGNNPASTDAQAPHGAHSAAASGQVPAQSCQHFDRHRVRIEIDRKYQHIRDIAAWTQCEMSA